MYFWGQDVLEPSGNLLRAFGCETYQCPDAPHMVRCYRKADVTLHSSGVCLLPADGPGVAYLRPYHRLFLLPPSAAAPLTCGTLAALKAAGLRSLLPHEMPSALRALPAFVDDYETWAAPRVPPSSRMESWRDFRRVPKAVRWLPPQDSSRWLQRILSQVHCIYN